jgi:hypothetical protein
VDYVTTKRHMVRDDGSILPLRIREDCNGSHVDTNCYFLLRGAFHTLARWTLMPQPMHIYGDRVYLASLREEGLRTVCTEERSVHYLCTWAPVPGRGRNPAGLRQGTQAAGRAAPLVRGPLAPREATHPAPVGHEPARAPRRHCPGDCPCLSETW